MKKLTTPKTRAGSTRERSTSTFVVKDGQGQDWDLKGDPTELRLADAFGKVAGKQGGELAGGVRIRAGGSEYGPTDMHRTLAEIGLVDGSVIEVLQLS